MQSGTPKNHSTGEASGTPCVHRGKKASCCQNIFECNCGLVSANACTPTVDSFASVVAGNPGIDAEAVGRNLHVCSECVHYQCEDPKAESGMQ